MQSHTAPLRLIAALLAFLLMASATSSARQGASRGVGVIRVRAENGEVTNLYDESHALVIGVSDYTNGWRSLPGVKRDAAAVEAVLRAQGFKVEVVTDPDGNELDQAIKRFIARHGQVFGNRLLIYFAGHGATLSTNGREMGYIVPADAPPPSRNIGQFKQTAVSMDVVESYARMIESKHALFVFDCCFSGSLFEANRASGPPAAITNRAILPVRQFITAGTAEQEVPDKSIFREQFVEALNGKADRNSDGYITGSELGEFLEDTVTNYSRGAQTPRWGKIKDPNLDKGNFVFLSPANTGLITLVPAKNEEIKQTDVPVRPVLSSVDPLCPGILTLVASSRRGFQDIVGEPIFKSSAQSFKSTVVLPGATSSTVFPDIYVYYTMAESDNVGDIASEYYRFVTRLMPCLPGWERKQENPSAVTSNTLEFRRTKFKEAKNGVLIEVSHIVSAPAGWNRYTLNLIIYKPGLNYW